MTKGGIDLRRRSALRALPRGARNDFRTDVGNCHCRAGRALERAVRECWNQPLKLFDDRFRITVDCPAYEFRNLRLDSRTIYRQQSSQPDDLWNRCRFGHFISGNELFEQFLSRAQADELIAMSSSGTSPARRIKLRAISTSLICSPMSST